MATTRKRLMVPAVDEPNILIVGDFTTGHKIYGPSPADDPGGFRHARVLLLDDTGVDYSLVPVRPLAELDSIDADADEPDPVEVKRAEFLHLAAEARALAEQADTTPDRETEMRENAAGMAAEALALAEELLA